MKPKLTIVEMLKWTKWTKLISTLSHKSRITVMTYDSQNELRGSEVETNYEGRNSF
jgi:hypothetical protein